MSTRPTGRELRKYISRQIPLLPREDMISVFKATTQMIAPEKFKKFSDGTRISLDSSIPDSVLDRIYDLIQQKLVQE